MQLWVERWTDEFVAYITDTWRQAFLFIASHILPGGCGQIHEYISLHLEMMFSSQVQVAKNIAGDKERKNHYRCPVVSFVYCMVQVGCDINLYATSSNIWVCDDFDLHCDTPVRIVVATQQ